MSGYTEGCKTENKEDRRQLGLEKEERKLKAVCCWRSQVFFFFFFLVWGSDFGEMKKLWTSLCFPPDLRSLLIMILYIVIFSPLCVSTFKTVNDEQVIPM